MKIRRLLSNIVCGFIPARKTRSKVRIMLNNPSIRHHIQYVRRWADKNCGGVKKLSVEFGVGCHNLVVLLNDEHVFKFFLVSGREQRAYHEERVVSALRKYSPIKIPAMELIPYDNSVVRHYEFVHGKMLTDFSPDYINKNIPKIAKQLADFLYVIGCADPDEIRDLKPDLDEKPGFLYGWFHNDIGNNFMMDDDLNIIAFIDCERMTFCDFKTALTGAEHFWDKNGIRGLMTHVLSEYSKSYYAKKRIKKAIN